MLGRTFQPSDTEYDVLVVERVARAFWPDTNPIGRSFMLEKEVFTVIGVVREIRHRSLDPKVDLPEFYIPVPGEQTLGFINIRCRSSAATT